MEQEEILKVKSATAIIGLIEKDNPKPIRVLGSGFVVGPEGYVVTAGHVFTGLRPIQKELAKAGTTTAIAAITHTFEGNKMQGNYIPFQDTYNLIGNLDTNPDKTIDLDIGIGSPITTSNDYPFLEFETIRKLNVLEEIFICGYPGASQSYRVDTESVGTELSPLIVPGHITALTPTDTAETSHGIFTSVTTTGGSSGSLILSSKSGKVIGLVQEVISAAVSDINDKQKIIGSAQSGFTYGLSYHIVGSNVSQFINQLRAGKKDLSEIRTQMPQLSDLQVHPASSSNL